MPRGVAHSLEIRSFLMGLHAQGRSLGDLTRELGIPRQVLSRWWQRVATDGLDGLAPRSRPPSDNGHCETGGPADLAVAAASARPGAPCDPGRREREDRASGVDPPRASPLAAPSPSAGPAL